LATYLLDQHLDLVETAWIVREDLAEWENPLDPTERRMIDEARGSGDIGLGTFHSWGHDAPDAGN
jgi:hypothetical protein